MVKPFDVTEYLHTPEHVAAYMNEVLYTGDPEFIMKALEDIMKTHVMTMTDVANSVNINRVSLVRAIYGRRDVRFSTMSGIADALGCRLAFVPKETGT